MNTTFGPAYDAKQDGERIRGQMRDILNLMIDGKWRTFSQIRIEIKNATGREHQETSISAQLRHLRKAKFGEYELKNRRVKPGSGLYQYKLLPPLPKVEHQAELFEEARA